MSEPTLGSWDTRPESVRELANQHADRQAWMANWYPDFFVRFRFFSRLGIELSSRLGYLASFLFYFVLIVLPALIITAIVGQLANIPLLSWIIVATAAAGLYTIGSPWAHAAADNIVLLHRALAREEEIRRLMAWDQRWYNVRIFSAVGGACALGIILVIHLLQRNAAGMQMPAGALWISAYLAWMVGQNCYLLALLFLEADRMSVCHYELYSLSPIDSLALKGAVRGYNQAGAVVLLLMTLVILGLLLLLPAKPTLMAPIVVSLLLVEYLGAAFGSVGTRLHLGHIVRAKKEQEMEPLRGELNGLVARLKELTEEEYDRMKRLQETHDAIRDSSENLLPLGDVAKVVGALALSTLTIVATAFADAYVVEWVKPFLP
jgi:hypothetical protein